MLVFLEEILLGYDVNQSTMIATARRGSVLPSQN